MHGGWGNQLLRGSGGDRTAPTSRLCERAGPAAKLHQLAMSEPVLLAASL